MKRVIDATDALVGRMATVVAKAALIGDQIVIVNCEAAVISGTKQTLEKKWRHRMGLGQPTKGPFIPRMPDRFIRRVIRGMLPYKQPKGMDAFRRIQCYLGVPDEFTQSKKETIESADLSTLNSIKFVRVKDLCRFMGGRI